MNETCDNLSILSRRRFILPRHFMHCPLQAILKGVRSCLSTTSLVLLDCCTLTLLRVSIN